MLSRTHFGVEPFIFIKKVILVNNIKVFTFKDEDFIKFK